MEVPRGATEVTLAFEAGARRLGAAISLLATAALTVLLLRRWPGSRLPAVPEGSSEAGG